MEREWRYGRLSSATMEWWQRLAQIIEHRSLRVQDVALRAGVAEKTLYAYLKGRVDNPHGDTVERLAMAVNMTEMQLRHGELPSNVADIKQVPVIDMRKLRKLKNSESPLTKWDGATKTPVSPDVSDACFLVRLDDTSGEPEFKRGDSVICDPTAEISPGDFVIAILTDEEQCHFARYRPVSHRKTTKFLLVHINKDFPDVEVGGVGRIKGFVLGRVMKHIRDL